MQKTVATRVLVGVAVALLVAVAVGVQALSPSFLPQTGLIVSGDTDIDFYEADKITQLTSISWGDISVNAVNRKYIWMYIDASGKRLSFYADNSGFLLFEVFYQSGSLWCRWSNSTSAYFQSQWVQLMIRLTAQSGSPAGSFSFDAYFTVQ